MSRVQEFFLRPTGTSFARATMNEEKRMRVILLWLLGVPLGVLILMMLFGIL